MSTEGNGEISDTDSGIILHSGSDSPTSHAKDVSTHTRAMKLKHRALQDRLERCLLELKDLCIREAELTGRLSDDYPLLPGEKPPQIRRRIGAAFKLDEQSIPRGEKESELSLADGELALQLKIYEAARKLCEEEHPSKAVRRSRLQQCKREEKKLKHLQETTFRLRLQHGRSSPLPAFSLTQLELGTSDDSSLSDSAVQDEEVASQSSQPSSELPCAGEADASAESSVPSQTVVSPSLPPTPSSSPRPSLDSSLSLDRSAVYDSPPIQHSPWTESSLDQPYQKTKRSCSSSKTSSPKTELLPPLEACLPKAALPLQLSHLRLCRSLSNSTPSTPELGVHRQLSLRLSSPESSLGLEKERGRSRGPRRRLTEYQITLPESPAPARYGNRAGSEDGNSERSFASYDGSPCRELPGDPPKRYPAAFRHAAPFGSHGPRAFPDAGSYRGPGHRAGFLQPCYNEDAGSVLSYSVQRVPYPSSRYDYCYEEAPAPPQRPQRPRPPDVRPPPSPALWDHPHCRPGGLRQQVVNEQLKSWHRRSQLKAPRSRSLDRQGAVRVKSSPGREIPRHHVQKHPEQVIQRRALHVAADEAPGRWLGDDGSHYISQV